VITPAQDGQVTMDYNEVQIEVNETKLTLYRVTYEPATPATETDPPVAAQVYYEDVFVTSDPEKVGIAGLLNEEAISDIHEAALKVLTA